MVAIRLGFRRFTLPFLHCPLVGDARVAHPAGDAIIGCYGIQTNSDRFDIETVSYAITQIYPTNADGEHHYSSTIILNYPRVNPNLHEWIPKIW